MLRKVKGGQQLWTVTLGPGVYLLGIREDSLPSDSLDSKITSSLDVHSGKGIFLYYMSISFLPL